jgi:hypothetical protein
MLSDCQIVVIDEGAEPSVLEAIMQPLRSSKMLAWLGMALRYSPDNEAMGWEDEELPVPEFVLNAEASHVERSLAGNGRE